MGLNVVREICMRIPLVTTIIFSFFGYIHFLVTQFFNNISTTFLKSFLLLYNGVNVDHLVWNLANDRRVAARPCFI